MSTSPASEIGNTVRVFDPVAYAASLLVIVTACVLAASVLALHAGARRSDREAQKRLRQVTAQAPSTRLLPYRAGQPTAGIVPDSQEP